jgi:hypothetical protein
VVLLSATPAKNSPLEFYNLYRFVDPQCWLRLGIRDPEQFVDRYCRLEMRSVLNVQMAVEQRSACVGFQNLHEHRDVIFRYGEYKTAEQVGLKLPEPRVEIVHVDMDRAQERKYEDYVQQIQDALSGEAQDRGRILGLLARLALVAIHAELDVTKSPQIADPHSPKLDECAKRIVETRNCGHIVFVDNIAIHHWMRRVLVEAGVPIERIAIMNADSASSAERQKIASDFNGDPDAGIVPKYDVVIANAVAYEGIDLQTRTCAIHHLDLPWEPATLQQRNGRGVRQGNRLAQIAIYYYFANRSQDGIRFGLIQGKRGWMAALIESQARDTNNPGAQLELGPEEVLVLISRDPAATQRRPAEVRAKAEAAARAKVAEEAVRLLRSANTRFRQAEMKADPVEAARLRLEAEERIDDLQRVDPVAWPFAKLAYQARDHDLSWIGQAPVWSGLRLALEVPGSGRRYIEIGETERASMLVLGRQAGMGQWGTLPKDLRIEPAAYDPADWPADDDERTQAYLQRAWLTRKELRLAGEAWLDRWWPTIEPRLRQNLQQAFYDRPELTPTANGQLYLDRSGRFSAPLLLWTTSAWKRFVELGRAGIEARRFTWAELDTAAQGWWGRRFPRGISAEATDHA